jgi:rhodanese-related sulfurtransferase
MTIDAAISTLELKQRVAAFPPPAVLDVRRQPAFDAHPELIPGAVRHTPESIADWAGTLEPWRPVIPYCAHGHEVSQGVATALRERGFDARFLAGGIDAWQAGGHATCAWRAPTRWVTRERPKIDRIACPWLIRRFIDASAEFFYVPNAEVGAFAAANAATAYDIPDVTYAHVDPECSFDAFVRLHDLEHPALDRLASIVRGADTAALDLAREAPGLLAASRGLSAMFADDHEMLKWGMLVYDALYEWCRETQPDDSRWYPVKLRTLVPA